MTLQYPAFLYHFTTSIMVSWQGWERLEEHQGKHLLALINSIEMAKTGICHWPSLN